RDILSILCLVLAYSCAQAWNFGSDMLPSISLEREYPWLVAVQEECSVPLGGGSLISNYVVLTASQPIEGRNVSALRVTIDTSSVSKGFGVRTIVRHPNFSRTSGALNLALLFLKKPIEFTSEIAPINLATQASLRNLDLTSCIAKGSRMKTLPLPVVSTATCQQDLRRWLGASFQLDSSLMCAGGGFGRNICEEDGYPLVCPLARDPSKFQQVGIINWHINCGEDAIPDVYTNVARVHDWINQQIHQNPYVEGPAA
ncbi:hypothetical protein KR038_007100, partial [Drosophila bunnanda]